MKIYDISRPLDAQIAVWPGDRDFSSEWTTTIRESGSVNVGSVAMSTHTGTHADAPLHYAANGADIASLPLENYIGPAVVVEISDVEFIEISHIDHIDLSQVKRILFKTKSSAREHSQWIDDITWLGTETAEYMGQNGVKLVGMDAPSVDKVDSKELPTHHMLHKYNISNLENLYLRDVPPGEYELIALPLKLAGLDASPVRAVLISRD